MKRFCTLWITLAFALGLGIAALQPAPAQAAVSAHDPALAGLVMKDNEGNVCEKTGVEVFRVNNTATGEHLFTTSPQEVGNLTQSWGTPWIFEDIAWYAPETGVGVYRLYNPYTNLHLYTTDQNEIRSLTAGGWSLDFEGRPLFYSGGSINIYRLYNDLSSDHHLTTDENEYRSLPNAGWTPEGAKLSALGAGEPYPNEWQVTLDILALQDKYPDWTPWNNSNFYRSSASIPMASAGYGCYGFALMCSDAAFGWLPGRLHHDTNNIRPGDMLRINYDTHSVVALSRSGDQLLICEGNINDSVYWGRKISISQTPIDYIITRYPE